MPRKRKIKKSKQKSPQILWSLLVSLIGMLAIAYLLLWFVVPNIVPVERSMIGIIPAQFGGEVLMVGLDDDSRQNQAIMLSFEQSAAVSEPLSIPTEKLEKRIWLSNYLGLLIDEVIVIDQTWPNQSNSGQMAKVIREEIFEQLRDEQTVSPNLILTWYLLKNGSSFSRAESINTVTTEFKRGWGSALTAGDDCQIAVLNSTDTSGLASDMTDLIESNGGVVIRLKQYAQQLETSSIYVGDSPACNEVVVHLEQLFVHQPAVMPMEAAQGTYRAPLVIILGTDYAQSLE